MSNSESLNDSQCLRCFFPCIFPCYEERILYRVDLRVAAEVILFGMVILQRSMELFGTGAAQ